jgi:hypothetical protein
MTSLKRTLAELATNDTNTPLLKLPYPYLTSYGVAPGPIASTYVLRPLDAGSRELAEPLHNAALHFTAPEDPKLSERPSESNNTAWGRARRSPSVTASWTGMDFEQAPTLAQLWLVAYAVFTLRPEEEAFRLKLFGFGVAGVAEQLRAVGLAIAHPAPAASPSGTAPGNPQPEAQDELLVLRGPFWQGAGSPFGPRPVWVLGDALPTATNFPLLPLDYTLTCNPPTAITWHPRRPVKPTPGSVIYSRWIAHLGEMFSMVALDYTNEEHLGLFHTWQNDPRVSQGWNETGTLEEHRGYLQRMHDDPHQIAVLAAFEGTFFAYFEIYWGQVSVFIVFFPVICLISFWRWRHDDIHRLEGDDKKKKKRVKKKKGKKGKKENMEN